VASVVRGTSVASGGQTNADSVDFLVNFNEAMHAASVLASSFAVQLNGSVLTSGVSVATPVQVSDTQYRVSVSGTAIANANGSLALVLAAGQGLQDSALNTISQTAIASSQGYVLDNTAPAISAIERGTSVAPSGHTNLASVDFIVAFSEAVDTSTLSASDFVAQLDGTPLSSQITLGAPLALGDNRYRISVSGDAIALGNGVLTLALASDHELKDPAGNALSTTLPNGAASYVLDHIAPTAVLSSISDDVSPNTGSLVSGARTNDTSVELAGTNQTGGVVKVYNGSTFLGNATVVGAQWSYTATLVNGSSYNFKVTETDLAGNTSEPTAGFVLISDTAAPSAATGLSEQGSSLLANNHINASEADSTWVVRVGLPSTGSLPLVGDSLVLQLNGQNLSSPAPVTLTDAHLLAGFVDITVGSTALGGDGVKGLSARLVDGAGNLSLASASLSLTRDTVAPSAPALAEPSSSTGPASWRASSAKWPAGQSLAGPYSEPGASTV
jgi:hypothetical protein